MKKYTVLYNPLSNNGKGEYDAKELNSLLSGDELTYVDVTKTDNLDELVKKSEDAVILCGGDGTINRFINTVDCDNISVELYYFPTGTGNDFYTDIKTDDSRKPIQINQMVKNLPTVSVNGQNLKFINGVGYGIDGYCCEVADKIRESDSSKKINYTAIAIKGLLGAYKSNTAVVSIDGEIKTFENVWIASAMKGRYYGGGMKMAPDRDRDNCDDVTLVIYHAKSKLIALSTFPKIFTGDHVKSADVVEIFHGKDIHVAFNKPSALQVDGETFLDVLEYSVKA